MVDYINPLSQPGQLKQPQLETANKDKSILSDNFDTFLQILTAQLKSQDPLDPVDANSFTDQLVQFSGVEQSILTNQHLEKISSQLNARSSSDALLYLGKNAVIDTSTVIMNAGEATWTLNADAAAKATITIQDANGDSVYSEQVVLQGGEQAFQWSGTDNNGVTLPDGQYTIAVQAIAADGQGVRVASSTKGEITAVDLSTPEPYVIIADKRISLSAISRLEI